MEYNIVEVVDNVALVRFTLPETGAYYERCINTVVREDGSFDSEATHTRIKLVQKGVQTKLLAGAIVFTEPQEE